MIGVFACRKFRKVNLYSFNHMFRQFCIAVISDYYCEVISAYSCGNSPAERYVLIDYFRKLFEYLVALVVSASVIYNVEAVYIKDYYPVRITKFLTTVISFFSHSHNAVSVRDFRNFISICHSFNEHIFFLVFRDIHESSAYSGFIIFKNIINLVSVEIPVISSVSRHKTKFKRMYLIIHRVGLVKPHNICIKTHFVFRVYSFTKFVHINRMTFKSEHFTEFL